jgi:hypothetical protein
MTFGGNRAQVSGTSRIGRRSNMVWLMEPAVQRTTIHPEDARGLGLVASHGSEHLTKVPTLHLVHCDQLVR